MKFYRISYILTYYYRRYLMRKLVRAESEEAARNSITSKENEYRSYQILDAIEIPVARMHFDGSNGYLKTIIKNAHIPYNRRYR